ARDSPKTRPGSMSRLPVDAEKFRARGAVLDFDPGVGIWIRWDPGNVSGKRAHPRFRGRAVIREGSTVRRKPFSWAAGRFPKIPGRGGAGDFMAKKSRKPGSSEPLMAF